MCLSAGSNRSFTAYIFRRLDPPGQSFKGSQTALLSSLLTAPRLLQTSLPRLLRRRNPKPSYVPEPDTQTAKSKPRTAPRGRVALADTTPQLRTAAEACSSAADLEAAQACLGPPGGTVFPPPRGEPTPAQGPLEEVNDRLGNTAEKGHGPSAPPAAGHACGTTSTETATERAVKKNLSRCRNGKLAAQTLQHEVECEDKSQLGNPRSPCAELSNKPLSHGSSDELPAGAARCAFAVSAEMYVSMRCLCLQLTTLSALGGCLPSRTLPGTLTWC